MKLGLIARCDNSGLGVQCWEFARHMKPDKTMVLDLDHITDDVLNCNKNSYRERYPDGVFVEGWHPTRKQMSEFLDGLDMVYTVETPYDYELFIMAMSRGIKTILHLNWEFLDYLQYPALPEPTLFASPSTWHYDDIPYQNKAVLSVPVATDRLPINGSGDPARQFLHVVGRPAIHDRNGTSDLLRALQYVEHPVDLTLRCQAVNHPQLREWLEQYPVPEHVNLDVVEGDTPDYWDIYPGHDVLIMPRRYGGLCLPVNEALGCGMPVIMTDISPNNDWLPKEWLVPAVVNDHFKARTTIDVYTTYPLDLAAKIDQFAQSGNLWHDAKAIARRFRDELSWNNMQQQYASMFESLTANPRLTALNL